MAYGCQWLTLCVCLHFLSDKSEANLAKYAAIRDFAKLHNVTAFPAGRGIGHQVMVEEGLVLPGKMVVASDSHSNMYTIFFCCLRPRYFANA